MQQEPNNKETKKVSWSLYIGSLLIVLVVSIFGTTLALNYIQRPDQTAETGQTEIESVLESDGEAGSEIAAFQPLEEVYSVLMTEYLEEVDSEALIQGALEGMAQAVEDPYTEYWDEVEATSADEDISGSFEGIGAEVMKEGDYVRIISPISGSPADEAGLLPNDYIVQVDGEPVADLSISEAVELIRGPAGSDVDLLIRRGDSDFNITLTRDSIPVESVVYELDETDPTIGYIHITNFNRPTYQEVVDAIEDLQSQGAEEFIFDVRGNPGGLLDSALNISNIFVEDGEILMMSQGRGEEPFVYVADTEQFGDFKLDQESVLLINGGSASASEILAGAMGQSADIPLIGTSTFGKGTIQSIEDIDGAGDIKYTAGRWLTPDGTWINEDGIDPDIEVEMPEYVNYLLINQEEEYQEGDVSENVENIENILQALGYDPGTADPIFDEETEEAVINFQTENEIEPDGVVTGVTARTLTEELRALIENNDTQYEAAVEYLQEN